MNKTLFIMRGLPGSGKSSWARTHAASAILSSTSIAICSTDDYHMVDGEYRFDPDRLGYFHKLNQDRVRHYMMLDAKFIFVDNTNIRRKDFQPYVDMAVEHGYEVEEVVIGRDKLPWDESYITMCAERNTHGVPREAIERMARKFQL